MSLIAPVQVFKCLYNASILLCVINEHYVYGPSFTSFLSACEVISLINQDVLISVRTERQGIISSIAFSSTRARRILGQRIFRVNRYLCWSGFQSLHYSGRVFSMGLRSGVTASSSVRGRRVLDPTCHLCEKVIGT